MKKARVSVFVSGSGTNMENIVRRSKTGELPCEVVLVVCDQPKAYALMRARQHGIETVVIERKPFKTRSEFDAKISEHLKERQAEFIFLAGFMRILGPEFVREWAGRILNIHPSLLPKYPGMHAIRDAYVAREKETGVTVHLVDEGVDTGPIIVQRPISIRHKESFESLEARVHELEYELYAEAIRQFLSGKFKAKPQRTRSGAGTGTKRR